MKKFYIMLLALLVAFVIIIPSAVQVMAKNPQDNKPVAWVNSATNTNNGPNHIAESSSVKLLADGTTVGKVVTHNWEMGWKEFGNTFDDNETKFYREGESKIAVFAVNLRREPSGLEFKMRFTLVDNGEGKNSDPDTLKLEIWLPDWDPNAPPIWFPANPANPGPSPLPNGNNQVHLPDED